MLAWLAHAYTAAGAVLAFLAAVDVFEHDYRTAFFWLYLQVAIDATDGVLARALGVKTRLPWFNGAKLDDIVDYLCYVFVPALVVWRAILVPDAWAVPVAAAMLLSSAYGFNREDAKTSDHFFLGFPSYWNIVVFYLFVARWPAEVNAAILVVLALLVFVPIRYLYPSRSSAFQVPTLVLGVVWGALMLVMLWQFPAVSRAVFFASLVFPV
jgi:phosphatidylcholine synthase